MRIFYAWQSDVDKQRNHYFIKIALEKAIKRMKKDVTITDSPREQIILDHDTKGVPGMPDIVGTIFSKIENSDIFVADLTYTAGSTTGQNDKLVSNPNVVFEMGYAFKVLGPERIISVLNTCYGPPEKLFFDISHRRWPIQYALSENCDLTESERQADQLADTLYRAISKVKHAKQRSAKGLSVFSRKQENEFNIIWNDLNFSVRFVARARSVNIELDAKLFFKELKFEVPFREVLVAYLDAGYSFFALYQFHYFLQKGIDHEFPVKRGQIDIVIRNSNSEIRNILLAHQLTLPRQSQEDPFSKKMYIMRNWIRQNGLNTKFFVLSNYLVNGPARWTDSSD